MPSRDIARSIALVAEDTFDRKRKSPGAGRVDVSSVKSDHHASPTCLFSSIGLISRCRSTNLVSSGLVWSNPRGFDFQVQLQFLQHQISTLGPLISCDEKASALTTCLKVDSNETVNVLLIFTGACFFR